MKKFVFVLMLAFYGIAGHAQKANLVSAWNYLKYNELDKAKKEIDAAEKHEVTSGMAKTWYYKALVYEKIYKNTNPAFAALDADPLRTAFNAYEKSLQIDPKSEFAEDIAKGKADLYLLIFNKGIEEFQGQKFNEALNSFEMAIKISPNDTMAILNAATSADRAGNKEKATSFYKELIKMQYKDPKIYAILAEIYKSDKDTAKALETIQAGRKLYPKDQILVVNELNIYLSQGKNKLAQDQFTTAIANDPTNPTLQYNYGLVCEKIGDAEKAESAYKKAIELKPDFFDAIYSIGAMHFNRAAEMANAANNIKPEKVKEYNLAKQNSDAVFAKALPYLEKAYELNPKDKSTVFSLKQLYVRLGNTEKYKKMKAELEQLK